MKKNQKKILSRYTITADQVAANVVISKGVGFVPVYQMEHATIDKATTALLNSVRKKLLKTTEVSADEIFDVNIVKNLKARFAKKASKMIDDMLPGTNPQMKQFLIGSLLHEMLGLGRIELLLNDPNLEEIVVNSSKEPIWVYHKDHGWLKTNIYVGTEEQVENYASIIARRVGRQISTLKPLLDAHLITQERANATLFPVSSHGNTMTIRKSASKAWTITDFIANKTMTSEIAAFFWLCMQYELNAIVAGGTASGKTALLNTLMPFIQPYHRIISIEDSVSGDSEILVKKDGKIEKRKMGELIDGCLEEDCSKSWDGAEICREADFEVLSLDSENNTVFAKPQSLIRHKTGKDLYEVRTASGRKIEVTEDHSLFSMNNGGELTEVRPKDLSDGKRIATVRKMPEGEGISEINLLEHLDKFKSYFVKGKAVKRELKKNKALLKKKVGREKANRWIRKGFVRTEVLEELKEEFKLSGEDLEGMRLLTKRATRYKRSSFPMKFELTPAFLEFLGLWIGDGSYDNYNQNRVILTTKNEEISDTVRRLANEFGIRISLMNDGCSHSLNSRILYKLMKGLGFDCHSATKTIPDFIFNLSNEQLSHFLKGVFSADGCVKPHEISYCSQSKKLLNDLQTLLLRFGIISNIFSYERKDKCKEMSISGFADKIVFHKKIGFIQFEKGEALESAIKKRKKLYSKNDVIPFRKALFEEFGLPGVYLRNKVNVGREYLQSYGLDAKFMKLYWDKVVSVRKVKEGGCVYDISVPQYEKFICNNIILHNTRELFLPDFLHWVPLVTREPNPEGKGEVSMLDLMINSLRMRPDRIVVGEIRKGRQAEVLFEAMHTGHSVYSTLHADTADQAMRRLTHPPIEVPPIMLESLHLLSVQYRDRRLGFRRIYQLAEVIPSGESEKEVSIKPNVLYRCKAGGKIVSHNECVRTFDVLGMHTGMSERELIEELSKRMEILEWMTENNINTVNTVGKVVAEFYRDENDVVNLVEKDQSPKKLLDEYYQEISGARESAKKKPLKEKKKSKKKENKKGKKTSEVNE